MRAIGNPDRPFKFYWRNIIPCVINDRLPVAPLTDASASVPGRRLPSRQRPGDLLPGPEAELIF